MDRFFIKGQTCTTVVYFDPCNIDIGDRKMVCTSSQCFQILFLLVVYRAEF